MSQGIKGGTHFCLHFTDAEVGGRGRFSELSEVTASKWHSQAFNPAGLAPESMLLHSALCC